MPEHVIGRVVYAFLHGSGCAILGAMFALMLGTEHFWHGIGVYGAMFAISRFGELRHPEPREVGDG